jgi:hypothetical protein
MLVGIIEPLLPGLRTRINGESVAPNWLSRGLGEGWRGQPKLPHL